MNDEHELGLLLASRFPIIAIDSHEEPRALELLARCASRHRLPVFAWSLTSGWKALHLQQMPFASTQEPAAALRHVAAMRQPGVHVLLDFHPFLREPLHVRLLKEIAADYERVPRTVVLLSHRNEVPPEVEKFVVRFELALPDEAAIGRIVEDEVQAWERGHAPARLQRAAPAEALLRQHLRGLPEPDVRRLLRQAIEADGMLADHDVPRVVAGKHRILGRDGALSFEIDTGRFAEVAGLVRLKQWLERRRAAFVGDVTGLDQPKGILLLGVQGCGKSLAAKAVAGAWRVPLMRLDIGALFNKYLGETERNLREALKAADAMAPCVLWVDEIEKGLAEGQGGDNGESRRLLGTLLTWMAERRSRVFIVATANDIEALPPELVRKGRFDEIFFVDLPDAAARTEVLRIHCVKRGQDPARFDLRALAERAEGFSGAELEQALICALYEAHALQRPLDDALLVQEIERTRPLSRVMAERVARLRAWAAERTVSAD
ncbi:MAG: AAA family ATPase [Piscinibacter sp.]|nr:AAA family ATPase [Piscinibacter sp.]